MDRIDEARILATELVFTAERAAKDAENFCSVCPDTFTRLSRKATRVRAILEEMTMAGAGSASDPARKLVNDAIDGIDELMANVVPLGSNYPFGQFCYDMGDLRRKLIERLGQLPPAT